MQEVSALCDRVIVINKGELVADSTLSNLLQNQNKSISVVVEFEGFDELEALRSIEGVANIERVKPATFKITTQHNVDIRPQLFRFAADHKLSLLGLKQEESSLENIFRELTAKQES
jgi:ABC-2 type transport system ATP-binding protein